MNAANATDSEPTAAESSQSTRLMTIDCVASGVTAFLSQPEREFRYSVDMVNGKIGVWLEDPTSKQQW